MALINCPECGREISDKAQSCPHCGNPMQDTVTDVNIKQNSFRMDEFRNYIMIARRAKNEGNVENAEKYYDLALRICPDSWEASFYQVYYSAMKCKIAEIENACMSVAESLRNTFPLVKKYVDPKEIYDVVGLLIIDCSKIADQMASAAHRFYIENKHAPSAFNTCKRRIACTMVIMEASLSLTMTYFPDLPELATLAAKNEICLYANYWFAYKKSVINTAMDSLQTVIRTTEPDYKRPLPKKSGCYVATCVYGSYDCPQVWTLRRYRDFTLSKTWYGRTFIRVYYAVSPSVVKTFGQAKSFQRFWRRRLDRMVAKLNGKGIEDSPYQDRCL